jgi:hypothetical protein
MVPAPAERVPTMSSASRQSSVPLRRLRRRPRGHVPRGLGRHVRTLAEGRRTGSGCPPDLLRLARRRSAGRRMPSGLWLREDSDMTDAPILICYDGSDDADRAIATAATIVGSRRAVVLDIAPPLTGAESVAAVSSVVPGNAFEDLNTAEAGRVASQGADIARGAKRPRGSHLGGNRRRRRRARRSGDRDQLERAERPARDPGGESLAPDRRARGTAPVLIVPPPHGEH